MRQAGVFSRGQAHEIAELAHELRLVVILPVERRDPVARRVEHVLREASQEALAPQEDFGREPEVAPAQSLERLDRDSEHVLQLGHLADPRIAQLGHIAVPFGSPAEVLLKDKGLYEEDMAYLYSLVNFRSARNEYTQIDPARMIAEVASGAAGAAVGFAPDVARYVNTSSTQLRMTLIEDDAAKTTGEKVPQRFDQSVGVRRDDAALLQQVNAALSKAKPRIDAILQADGVPLLPVAQ